MSIVPLIEVLGKIKDNRNCQGRRYNLGSILSSVVLAMLSGASSFAAISEWCSHHGNWLKSLMIFPDRTPCPATFHNVLKTIDVLELEAKLGEWIQESFLISEESLAIDGKSMRGAKKQGSSVYHLLSAVSSHLGITAYQWNVGEKTGEIKGFNQILKGLLHKGKILTMDALLTQRKIAKEIAKSQCAYLMVAKDNQEYLKEDIANLLLFKGNIGENMCFEQHDKGHGRIETRRIEVCLAEDYIDWPDVKQVFSIEREVVQKGKQSYQKVYGLTNLSPQEADAQKILSLNRGHWSVENKSHWVRDVVYREDHSQIRVGGLPQVMAIFRNLAIALIKASGQSVTKANRLYATNHSLSLELLFQRIK